jgi:Zn-dependent protease with chaperone function
VIRALCLLLVSSALIVAGPRALTRLTRSGRHPLAALVAWQLASWSVLGSVALAAALLAAPELGAASRLPIELEEDCLHAIHHMHNLAHSPLLQAVAALALGGVLFRLGGCAARAWGTTRRLRARHRVLLGLVSRCDPDFDADVVDDDTALVYCLPGHGGRVVFTSAALSLLSAEQRDAVLAHERAHLRGRHHALLASAGLLRSTFPRIRLFTQACEYTALLIEMRADDVAGRRSGRRPLAEALLRLTTVTTPEAALGAAGITTMARIERLLRPPSQQQLSVARQIARDTGLAVAASLLPASPVLLAVAGHALLCPV